MGVFKRNLVGHCEDPLTLAGAVLTKLHSIWVSATYPFASKGRNLSVHPTCQMSRRAAHRIALGESVRIAKDAWLNIPDMLTGGRELAIIIGNHCVIARRSQISALNRIELQNNVILSAAVLISDHIHAFQDPALPIQSQGITAGGRVIIEQGCWIGYGAAIVCDWGDLVIGRNSVIAANAVVTRSVPPCSVVAGNPSRVVKQYDFIKKQWVLGSAHPPRIPPALGSEGPFR